MATRGTENKNTGSFYTPTWCTDMMLDMSGFDTRFSSREDEYAFRSIDPACGDGAMLVRVCVRMIDLLRKEKKDNSFIATFLRENLYGFELDRDESRKAACNIANAASECGVALDIDDLHIIAGDAFESAPSFYRFFDFVIGNPPYVRIHNLEEKPDSPYIEGMCDLYLAFYDLGQRLLNNSGRLVFIAPSSWMTSRAGKPMRDDLRQSERISALLDFEHCQVFDNATAYTAIVVLDKDPNGQVDVYRFDLEQKGHSKKETKKLSDCWINGSFYADADAELTNILLFDEALLDDEAKSKASAVKVRNGYATMRDTTFISSSPRFAGSSIEIEVVKASKAKKMYALYPHDKNGGLIPLEDIRSESSDAYDTLVDDKDALLARNKVDASRWWGYGRSQGIADTYVDKVTVQSIVHPDKSPLTRNALAGCGVFGGLYVVGMTQAELDSAVNEAAFWKYVQALAKYKSGGYYTFGGKELEKYLKWWRSGQPPACIRKGD